MSSMKHAFINIPLNKMAFLLIQLCVKCNILYIGSQKYSLGGTKPPSTGPGCRRLHRKWFELSSTTWPPVQNVWMWNHMVWLIGKQKALEIIFRIVYKHLQYNIDECYQSLSDALTKVSKLPVFFMRRNTAHGTWGLSWQQHRNSGCPPNCFAMLCLTFLVHLKFKKYPGALALVITEK